MANIFVLLILTLFLNFLILRLLIAHLRMLRMNQVAPFLSKFCEGA